MRNEKFQIHFHAQYSVIYKGAKLGGEPQLFLPRLKIIYSPSSANVMGTFLVEIHVIEVSYKTSIFSAPPRTYLCICPTAFKPQLLPLLLNMIWHLSSFHRMASSTAKHTLNYNWL